MGDRRLSLDRMKSFWYGRQSELERLASRKCLSSQHVQRIRALLEEQVGKKQRPNAALILKTFEAREDWQVSVRAGQTVTVLDKLDDGWWLIDLSRGLGRGPFGLIPGINCCWTTVQQEDQTTPKETHNGSSTNTVKMPTRPPLPPREDDNIPALPPRTLELRPPSRLPPEPPQDSLKNTPPSSPQSAPPLPTRTRINTPPGSPTSQQIDAPPLPARTPTTPSLPARPTITYTDDDLQIAYDYLSKLINGDGFTAIPPENFNQLCRNNEFANLVRKHADLLREKRFRQEEEDQAGVISFVSTSSEAAANHTTTTFAVATTAASSAD